MGKNSLRIPRSLQDARRNSPLRHILPIAEDRPPPYTGDSRDSADGLAGPLPGLVAAPKPASETPPPSYEEALYRQAGPPPALTTPPPPPTATVQVTVFSRDDNGNFTMHSGRRIY